MYWSGISIDLLLWGCLAIWPDNPCLVGEQNNNEQSASQMTSLGSIIISPSYIFHDIHNYIDMCIFSLFPPLHLPFFSPSLWNLGWGHLEKLDRKISLECKICLVVLTTDTSACQSVWLSSLTDRQIYLAVCLVVLTNKLTDLSVCLVVMTKSLCFSWQTDGVMYGSTCQFEWFSWPTNKKTNKQTNKQIYLPLRLSWQTDW
jgi:hypothetical protein